MGDKIVKKLWTIRVDTETHKQIMSIKNDNRFRNADEVILYLIKLKKQKGG